VKLVFFDINESCLAVCFIDECIFNTKREYGMKIINLLCLGLILLLAGCANKGGGGSILSKDEGASVKCNKYRVCYQNDMYYESTCMKWDVQWSKEGMKQLERVALLKQCYRDKDKIRDECFETDSKEVRLSKIEECKKIGIDPIQLENN
jgi:hypothetical protein